MFSTFSTDIILSFAGNMGPPLATFLIRGEPRDPAGRTMSAKEKIWSLKWPLEPELVLYGKRLLGARAGSLWHKTAATSIAREAPAGVAEKTPPQHQIMTDWSSASSRIIIHISLTNKYSLETINLEPLSSWPGFSPPRAGREPCSSLWAQK